MDRSARSSRRRFLLGAANGALGLVLAACGLSSESSAPTPSAGSSIPPPPTPTLSPTPSVTAGPSLRERIGQMLLVGFRGLTADQAPEIVADIRDRKLGGVLLFDT